MSRFAQCFQWQNRAAGEMQHETKTCERMGQDINDNRGRRKLGYMQSAAQSNSSFIIGESMMLGCLCDDMFICAYGSLQLMCP